MKINAIVNDEPVHVDIIQRERVTVAVVMVGSPTLRGQMDGREKRIFAGTAFRHPEDLDDPMLGARVACRRALIQEDDYWMLHRDTRQFRRDVYRAIRQALRAEAGRKTT